MDWPDIVVSVVDATAPDAAAADAAAAVIVSVVWLLAVDGKVRVRERANGRGCLYGGCRYLF